MPLPTPMKKETKEDFLARCMGDSIMVKEYPDKAQRYAVALTLWSKRKPKNFEWWK